MVNQNKLEFECELRRRQELKSEIEKEIKRLEEQKSMVEMPPRSAEAVSTEPAPVYVSTESQTQTDDISLPTIVLEDTTEKLFQTIGTQTDPMKPSIIRVPAIMVSPPEPTPPLPKPAMKSISVQTRPLRVRTRSMQTEEIRLDERLKRFAHLLPSALIPKVAPAEPERVPPSPPHPPRKSSKRTIRRSSTEPTPVEDSPPAKPYTTSDMGVGTSSPPSMTEVSHKRKSFRPKNILYSIDMSHNQEVVSSGDDYFQEEGDSGSEYQTVLSAPKPRGKQRANTLPVIPHSFASTASDAGSELSRRQPSIRRGAMVTSGMQAHGRPRSPSMAMSESGVTKVGPPFPVPARQSSRRPNYMSDRDMTGSPTSTRLIRKTSGPRPPRPKSVRKARSATTIRNSIGDDDRARSPPPLSVSSTAPDSPRSLPPPMPRDEILSPAFERHGFGQGTSRHRHQPSNNTSNTAESLLQQTSVVDAIAQTMIGEWMWKYVRRRRTFGAADPPLEDDTAGGQRHKRWVWLAPYERAVMWSSRQPTSGSALLGKSGRKRKRTILHPLGGPDLDDTISCVMDRVLTKKVLIQSVLDVKDDTPLPKGATQPVFNRSILILTPARALKFTAPTKERHYVWLTALSFLSHATDSGEGNISLPPPLPFEYEQVERQFRPKPPPVPRAAPARISAFSTTRDSVRLAKGKGRAGHPASPPPNISMTGYPGSGGVYGPGSHGGGGGSGTYPMNIATSPITRGATMSQETLSAEPPSIPRFPGTSRRRSNTNMRRPQTRSTSHGYERSLASYATSNTGSTIGGGSEEFYNVGVGGVGLTSANSSIVHGFGGNGGWEAGPMGTMRMEAFVDRRPRYERFEDSGSVAQRRRSRQDSFWGGGAGSRSSQFYGDEEDYDPFRGF